MKKYGLLAGVISDGCSSNFFTICLDSLQEHALETGNLSCDTLSDITITIVVFKRAIHADILQVFLRSNIGMAFLAGIDPDFQCVLIVAADAGIETARVQELAIIFVPCILVTTSRHTTIQCCCCSEVVNVGESQLSADGIEGISQDIGCDGIDQLSAPEARPWWQTMQRAEGPRSETTAPDGKVTSESANS